MQDEAPPEEVPHHPRAQQLCGFTSHGQLAGARHWLLLDSPNTERIMNGKASKRIRLAARSSNKPLKALKREYKILPYHRRGNPLWQPHSVLIRTHARRSAA